jgi:hypothetical protein
VRWCEARAIIPLKNAKGRGARRTFSQQNLCEAVIARDLSGHGMPVFAIRDVLSFLREPLHPLLNEKLRKKIKDNDSLQKAFEKAKESAWEILMYRPYTARKLLTVSFARKELDAISLQSKKTIGMYLETVKTTIVVNLKDVIEEAGGI